MQFQIFSYSSIVANYLQDQPKYTSNLPEIINLISFINNLQNHNTQFHLDEHYHKDNDEIVFICKVYEIKSIHTKKGCNRDEDICLEIYVHMITHQDGIEILSLKQFCLQEQKLLCLEQEFFQKKY
ncbi:hypothetical protein ABPG72_001077 [Tetrahymena utriculariae]